MGRWTRALRLAAFLSSFVLFAQDKGRIEGLIKSRDGKAVGGVAVELLRGEVVVQSDVSDPAGRFHLEGASAGTYSLGFKLANAKASESSVTVTAGATTTIDKTVVWDIGQVDTVTVYSASRRLEPIIEAPSSVTAMQQSDIELYGLGGQVPNVLAAAAGAEITQNGLYDYNFNVRGFNTPLNRRIQTTIDGRDPSIPFMAAQEWSQLSLLTDELEAVELLRGPSAALYGANSYNGVVQMRTKSPRDSPGGRVRFTFGELGTAKTEARWATSLCKGWYMKILGGENSSRDFTVSRNKSVEYPGLPLEALPLSRDRVNIKDGAIRFDKYFGHGRSLTFEGGGSASDGVVFMIGAGRFQSSAIRSWERADFSSPGWSVLGYYNRRDEPGSPALLSGARLFLHDNNVFVEAQGRRNFRRLRLMGGSNWGRESVNTADHTGAQTLISRPVAANHGAVYGLLQYSITEGLTLTAGGRIDASLLHPVQASPRVALSYRMTQNQSAWVSFNRAFQVANYGEQFARVPAGPPLDLSGVEQQLAPLLGGTTLGLNFVPVFALGNENLRVESVRNVEVGYKRLFGTHAFVTADYYHNWMKDFITELLPGINPAFPPYVAPSSLPAAARTAIAAALNGAIPGLTNTPDSKPEIVFSYGNSGDVTSQGIELGGTAMFLNNWQFNLSTSWFDFNLRRQDPGIQIHPNAPAHTVNVGGAYNRGPLDVTIRYRWVDGFPFASGFYVGPVPAYGVVDLSGRYRISPHWEIGTSVSNLANNAHYEIFGGDLLKRRALGFLAFSWK
jgi:outer membrane receptor protein involved in Fe transport